MVPEKIPLLFQNKHILLENNWLFVFFKVNRLNETMDVKCLAVHSRNFVNGSDYYLYSE